MTAEPYGSGVSLVVDTSAWVRQGEPAFRERWRATVVAERIAVCPAVSLELLAAARDQTEFARLDRAFEALPQAPVTAGVARAALQASRELGGRRRIPAIDYLVAAAAAERGFGVLHLDAHFDLLAEVLGFESVRIDA